MLSANDNYHHHVKAQIIKHLRELSYKTFKEKYPTCDEYYDENNKCDVEIIVRGRRRTLRAKADLAC